jgi:acyl-CoA thioesterase-1
MSRTTADTPRVLLIGDSISIGYTPTVRALLDGVADVHGLPIATKSSTRGLAEIDSHLNKMEWDLIHFNWGLNDLEQDAPGERRVPIDLYEDNLRELLSRLKNTGAILIWASTTPVPEGASARTPGDAAKYNAVAAKVMQDQNVLFNDLYAFALPRLETIQQKADVHFTKKGYAVLAEEVARHVERALPRTTR